VVWLSVGVLWLLVEALYDVAGLALLFETVMPCVGSTDVDVDVK
jgi:hypothetical protein